MAYRVLARKWRPQQFDEIVGQGHVTTTLKNAIKTGRIAHAYLLVGPRGIGKTTTARVLARALNCMEGVSETPCGVCRNCTEIAEGNCMDVIEIDAASNRGVDDIRSLRDNVRFSPAASKFKIYIIDEVHMLTTEAFNALLKTLEEPPEHVKFILATTEPHKLPATVISRCQRFDFARIANRDIVSKLRRIIEDEKVEAEETALYQIAKSAEGSMRDAQSILDQLMSHCDSTINLDDVNYILGTVKQDIFHRVTEAVREGNVSEALSIVSEIVEQGRDLGQFVKELALHFRNLLVARAASAKELIDLSEDEVERISEQAKKFRLSDLVRMVEEMSELAGRFHRLTFGRVALEMSLIRMSKMGTEISVGNILERLVSLEQRIESGGGHEQLSLIDDLPPQNMGLDRTAQAGWPSDTIAEGTTEYKEPETEVTAEDLGEDGVHEEVEEDDLWQDPKVNMVLKHFRGKKSGTNR